MFCRGFAYLAGIYFNFTITFSDLSSLRNPEKLYIYISICYCVWLFFFPLRSASYFMSLDHSFYVYAHSRSYSWNCIHLSVFIASISDHSVLYWVIFINLSSFCVWMPVHCWAALVSATLSFQKFKMLHTDTVFWRLIPCFCISFLSCPKSTSPRWAFK